MEERENDKLNDIGTILPSPFPNIFLLLPHPIRRFSIPLRSLHLPPPPSCTLPPPPSFPPLPMFSISLKPLCLTDSFWLVQEIQALLEFFVLTNSTIPKWGSIFVFCFVFKFSISVSILLWTSHWICAFEIRTTLG